MVGNKVPSDATSYPRKTSPQLELFYKATFQATIYVCLLVLKSKSQIISGTSARSIKFLYEKSNISPQESLPPANTLN